MKTPRKERWLAPIILLVVALGTGCNMLSAPFFLFAPEPKKEAALKQIAQKDKEIKVAILTYMDMELRPELLHADQELSTNLAAALRKYFKENEEKVVVISPNKVEEYKNKYPNWKKKDPAEIGEALKADNVIYLEIHELSLIPKGSYGTMYQGSVRITVALHDVHGTDDDSAVHTEFEYSFPSENRGGVFQPGPGDSIAKFREAFMQSLAKHLAWHFTSHTEKEEQKLCE